MGIFNSCVKLPKDKLNIHRSDWGKMGIEPAKHMGSNVNRMGIWMILLNPWVEPGRSLPIVFTTYSEPTMGIRITESGEHLDMADIWDMDQTRYVQLGTTANQETGICHWTEGNWKIQDRFSCCYFVWGESCKFFIVFPWPHSEFRSAVSWKLAEMTSSCGFLGLKASAIPVLDSEIFSISYNRWICKPWMMKDRGYPKNFEIKGGPPGISFYITPIL